jgi:hypothetical protein
VFSRSSSSGVLGGGIDVLVNVSKGSERVLVGSKARKGAHRGCGATIGRRVDHGT